MDTLDSRAIDDATRETKTVVAQSGGVSADMLAALFDQSSDCIKILTPQGRLSYISHNGRSAMEIDDVCTVQDKNWWDLWPAESQHLVRTAVAEASSGRAARFSAACPTAKGTHRWWEVSVSPVYDEQRQIKSLISISRDITEVRNDREAATVIALEMRHRLKNAFAVSGAIAKASARGASAETKSFADSLAQRFTVLAMAQGKVLDAIGNLPLEQFVPQLARKFDATANVINVVNIPPLRLDESLMRTVALVLGELGNNSLKYGALSRDGLITVSGRHENGRLKLFWDESFPVEAGTNFQNPASEGTGFGLLTRMAASAGGQFTRTLGANCLIAELTLPVA